MSGENQSNAVVDVTSFGGDDDGGIPTFLQRDEPAETDGAQATSSEGEREEAPEHAENPQATTGHNQPPMDVEDMRKEFTKQVGKLGSESGKGSAALPRLGLLVVRAAADGLISTEKPARGEKSDAVRIYEHYAANDSKHAEHTNGGMKANAAKLNALIGLGCMTTCDGVAIADQAVKLRDEMEAQELKPKALFAGLVDVARAQMDSDRALDDEAIKAALTKTPADKTLEKEWAAIQKRVDTLITGEGAHGLKDQSETALKIGELIKEHVALYVDGNKRSDLIETLMERGYTRAMAENIADKA